MPETKIAVILPVYRNDKVEYLKVAVESILLQSHKSIQLFIGVDGPVGDELRECLEAIGNRDNVCIRWFSENRGLACVLNDMLDTCFCQGYEYVARMDADDISMPDRIEKQLAFLEQNRDTDVVGGAIEEIDEEGRLRGKTIVYPATHEECRRFFARRNPHAHPAVMFRKSFFDKLRVKKYRPEYRQNQDTMLWYDGMMAGTIHANITDVVLRFRMTESLFKKRRNGWSFAKKQLKDRLMINRGLGYGKMADAFGVAMFCLLVSPSCIKRIAYRIFR